MLLLIGLLRVRALLPSLLPLLYAARAGKRPKTTWSFWVLINRHRV